MHIRATINGKEVTNPLALLLLAGLVFLVAGLVAGVVIFLLLPLIGVVVTLSLGIAGVVLLTSLLTIPVTLIVAALLRLRAAPFDKVKKLHGPDRPALK